MPSSSGPRQHMPRAMCASSSARTGAPPGENTPPMPHMLRRLLSRRAAHSARKSKAPRQEGESREHAEPDQVARHREIHPPARDRESDGEEEQSETKQPM